MLYFILYIPFFLMFHFHLWTKAFCHEHRYGKRGKSLSSLHDNVLIRDRQ